MIKTRLFMSKENEEDGGYRKMRTQWQHQLKENFCRRLLSATEYFRLPTFNLSSTTFKHKRRLPNIFVNTISFLITTRQRTAPENFRLSKFNLWLLKDHGTFSSTQFQFLITSTTNNGFLTYSSRQFQLSITWTTMKRLPNIFVYPISTFDYYNDHQQLPIIFFYIEA